MHKRIAVGFTIVELLIIIVVVAILSAMITVSYGGVQERARMTVVRGEMKSFNEQVQLFRAIERRMPVTESDFALILQAADLYDSTRTEEKSFAICASDTGYAFVAWEPIIEAYKNGDVLYLIVEGGGQTEHTLTNSSLSSEPNRVDKVCDQVYPSASYENWTYNID